MEETMLSHERSGFSLAIAVAFSLLFSWNSDLAAQVTAESAIQQSPPAQQTTADPCAAAGEAKVVAWKLAKTTLQLTLLRATQSQQAYQTEVLSLREVPACGSHHQRTIFNLLAGYDSKQQKAKPGSIVNRNGDLRLQHLELVKDDTRYLSVNS